MLETAKPTAAKNLPQAFSLQFRKDKLFSVLKTLADWNGVVLFELSSSLTEVVFAGPICRSFLRNNPATVHVPWWRRAQQQRGEVFCRRPGAKLELNPQGHAVFLVLD